MSLSTGALFHLALQTRTGVGVVPRTPVGGASPTLTLNIGKCSSISFSRPFVPARLRCTSRYLNVTKSYASSEGVNPEILAMSDPQEIGSSSSCSPAHVADIAQQQLICQSLVSPARTRAVAVLYLAATSLEYLLPTLNVRGHQATNRIHGYFPVPDNSGRPDTVSLPMSACVSFLIFRYATIWTWSFTPLV